MDISPNLLLICITFVIITLIKACAGAYRGRRK